MTESYKKEPAIYIFTNKINGKIYVGETMNLSNRMAQYRHLRLKRPIENALRKYGLDNFHFEYYYLPHFDKDSLLLLEEELIKKFQSLCSQHGYNVSTGGSGFTGGKHKEETKQHLAEVGTGKKHTEQSKIKMSIVKTGTTHSAATRQKISNERKDKPLSEDHRKKISDGAVNKVHINQYTREGEFIKTWDSIADASREVGCAACNITACLKGREKTCRGFIWKYV